jgi:hypothetical protein
MNVSIEITLIFHQPAFLIRAWMLIFNIGFSLHVASQRLLSDRLFKSEHSWNFSRPGMASIQKDEDHQIDGYGQKQQIPRNRQHMSRPVGDFSREAAALDIQAPDKVENQGTNEDSEQRSA